MAEEEGLTLQASDEEGKTDKEVIIHIFLSLLFFFFFFF